MVRYDAHCASCRRFVAGHAIECDACRTRLRQRALWPWLAARKAA